MARLRRRELVLAYDNVSKQARYIYNIAQGYGLTNAELLFPIYTTNYLQAYTEYLRLRGTEELMNIPIMIFPKCKSLAMTRYCMYFWDNSQYVQIMYSDILTVESIKKIFTMNIQITLRNGREIILDGGINKTNCEGIVFLMNAIIRCDENIFAHSNNYFFESVPVFGDYEYSLCKGIDDFGYMNVYSSLIDKYNQLREYCTDFPAVVFYNDPNWGAVEKRTKAMFDVPYNETKIMICDSSSFTYGKNIILLTSKGIYLKNSTTNIRVDINQLYRLSSATINNDEMLNEKMKFYFGETYEYVEGDNKLVIHLFNNDIIEFPLQLDSIATVLFVAWINEYLQGVQTVEKMFQ